ncbi:MAG TPA: CPBP family glutamic-type intramembrane protease [Candidatus Methylacidiphilales bacterium]|nr:CPBP family glutamic-type intramembrane protease [Candidatus Methylacidiphilales bacterium]
MFENALHVEHRVWLPSHLIDSWRRIAVTVFLMLGHGVIFGLIYGLTHHSGDFFTALLNDKALARNAVFESSLLGLFFLVLHQRKWTAANFRVRIGWSATMESIGLLGLTYGSLLGFTLPLVLLDFSLLHSSLHPWIHSLLPHTIPLIRGKVHLSWAVIIIGTVLNAFYEELVYMGYFFNQCAAKRGPWMAVAATILLRLAVHTYQGTEHILQIGIWSVVFGFWYRWSGKVWPLILAHAMIDLISLGALKVLFGGAA